jgi:hypothetical protein
VRSGLRNAVKNEIEEITDNPFELWKKLIACIENKSTHVKFGNVYIYEKQEICEKSKEYNERYIDYRYLYRQLCPSRR